jgi:hypothetical protein
MSQPWSVSTVAHSQPLIIHQDILLLSGTGSASWPPPRSPARPAVPLPGGSRVALLPTAMCLSLDLLQGTKSPGYSPPHVLRVPCHLVLAFRGRHSSRWTQCLKCDQPGLLHTPLSPTGQKHSGVPSDPPKDKVQVQVSGQRGLVPVHFPACLLLESPCPQEHSRTALDPP